MDDDPYVREVDVRYQDLDELGVLNNAVYATYMEEGRVGLLREGLGVDPDAAALVVAHLELDFERPIRDMGTAAVAVRVRDVGRTSLELAYEIRFEGRVVATGRTVSVAVDEAGSPRPLPASWRDALAGWTD